MRVTEIAKALNKSRPTVYKMIEDLGKDEVNRLAFNASSGDKIIQILALHNEVSTKEMESILEFLADNGLLSDTGKAYRSNFWKTFIKE